MKVLRRVNLAEPGDRKERVRALFAVSLCAAIGASCSPAASADPNWVVVARDPNYDIAIDTSRVEARFAWAGTKWFRVYDTWFRTDHKTPRLHNGKQFNRELVHSQVRCDSLQFKVVSVDMSMGDDKPIVLQRTEGRELGDQPWRPIEGGATEEITARAACYYGQAVARRAGRARP